MAAAKCLSSVDCKLDPVSGMVRLDQVPLFRLVDRGGVIMVQFMDGDKNRCALRGTQFIEIPYFEFVQCVTAKVSQFDG